MTSAEYHAELDSFLLLILRVGIHRLPKELRQRAIKCMYARMEFYKGVTEGDPSPSWQVESDLPVNEVFQKTKH